MKRKVRHSKTNKDIEIDIPDCLISLSDEEFAKVKPLTKKQIKDALEEGRKARQAAEEEHQYGQYICGRQYFR
jgi:hypothetical protein